MDDDQARLAGPPDAQLIEPRDPGLYVVIVVHGAQDTVRREETSSVTRRVRRTPDQRRAEEVESRLVWQQSAHFAVLQLAPLPRFDPIQCQIDDPHAL